MAGIPDERIPVVVSPAQADSFKLAFRQHPAGVALVTAVTDSGPVGLTASSVASVSVDPLALAFSVTRATGSAGALLAAGAITVHLLSDQQADLARAFATSGAPRFTPEQGWRFDESGAPHLPGARAEFRGRIAQTVPVGGSTLVLAEIDDVTLGEGAAPLLYHDRRFLALDPEGAEL